MTSNTSSSARSGILLVNLGTPDAPTSKAVRTYLKEFLSDQRVVELPKLIWLPILYGIILNTRPKKTAEKYRTIWEKSGSPLRFHTEKQALLLQGFLTQKTKAPIAVEYAMRYGNPSITQGLAKLTEHGCERVLIVPLYPQYSASTTATIMDVIGDQLKKIRNIPAIRMVKDFHQQPGYIKALANNINEYWVQNGRPNTLVMSFHGLPQRMVDKGDPYQQQCAATAQALAIELGLNEANYRVTYQSRFGANAWISPATDDTLKTLGEQKTARVDVVCPGFTADCLETLEEIAQEGKEIFQEAGGGEYHYIPCLNDRDDWIHALTQLTLDNLGGWID